MNVHILSLYNPQSNVLGSISDILSHVDGEIEFTFVEYHLVGEILNNLVADFQNTEDHSILAFESLFNICELYRNSISHVEEKYVVLISPFANKKGWFSAVKSKDIFIYPGYWEQTLPDQWKYATAYNIMVNLFQSLLNIDWDDFQNHPNIIHRESIGCINDFCNSKDDYIIKLRTGYICDKCIEVAKISQISNEILIQIYLTIKYIREKFMNFDKILEAFEPENLIVNRTGDIIIGNKTLILPALQKTLYIFFTKHLEGVDANDLSSRYLDELIMIYRHFRKENFNSPIINLCYSNFQYHKTCLNKSIIKQIGRHKSGNYIIKNFHINNEYIFKIELSIDKIDIQIN